MTRSYLNRLFFAPLMIWALKRELSVADGVDINALLGEIIDKKVYKDDYKSITEVLLYDSVDYETALSGVKRVVESGVFKR